MEIVFDLRVRENHLARVPGFEFRQYLDNRISTVTTTTS